MLKKSQIFYFLISFIATVTMGFFVWSLFIIPDNGIFAKVLSEINKAGSKFFPASMQSDYKEFELNLSPTEEEVGQIEQRVESNEISVYYTNEEATLTEGERQNILDDIQEKLDVISQQVQELVAEQNQDSKPSEVAEDKDVDNEDQDSDESDADQDDNQSDNNEETAEVEVTVCTGQININIASAEDLDKITEVGLATAQKIIEVRPFCSLNDLLRVSGIGETTLQKITEQGCAYTDGICIGSGGGGGSALLPIVYPKILISEVQILPIDQRFIELYNPNSTEANLTGWYLQRKTETADTWGSLISSTKFDGKIIPANGYFLISRELESSDILFDITLSDSNSLVLKNPNGEVSDKLGFGEALDSEFLATQNPSSERSIGRKVVDELEQDTDDNLADFEIDTPTPKLQNITYVEPPPLTDTTPPEVSFSLDPTQNNLDFTISFTVTDSIVDTVSPTGVGGYVFRWQEDGSAWQEDAITTVDASPTTVDLSRDFTGEDKKTYNFQVQATDVAGNISDWLPVTPTSTTISIPAVVKSILINEIQTAGQTTKDEFIELYNPNNSEVDLSGYALKKKTSGGTESNLVSLGSFIGTIPANGYFLIAPQINDDGSLNYTGSAGPDLYYSGKSYSMASNNAVLLYDKDNNLQDKVGFGTASDFETAVAVNPDDGKSISRITGIDTNDNSADFTVLDTPTPGQ